MIAADETRHPVRVEDCGDPLVHQLIHADAEFIDLVPRRGEPGVVLTR